MASTTTPDYLDATQVAIADENDMIAILRVGDLRAAFAYFASAANYFPDSVAGNLGVPEADVLAIASRLTDILNTTEVGA